MFFNSFLRTQAKSSLLEDWNINERVDASLQASGPESPYLEKSHDQKRHAAPAN